MSIDEVEMVDMLAKAASRGLQMAKVAAQFHDLVINESKDRLKRANGKQAMCGKTHGKKKFSKGGIK